MSATTSRHGFRFSRNGGRTPPRIECDDLARRFTEARQGGEQPEVKSPEKASVQPTCWPVSTSTLSVSRLPSFAFDAAEAWLMNDDAAIESLFSGDSWVFQAPMLSEVEEQPKPEQRSARRCKAPSTGIASPAICGRQVKTWFENRRCSEKRAHLGVKARRLRVNNQKQGS